MHHHLKVLVQLDLFINLSCFTVKRDELPLVSECEYEGASNNEAENFGIMTVEFQHLIHLFPAHYLTFPSVLIEKSRVNETIFGGLNLCDFIVNIPRSIRQTQVLGVINVESVLTDTAGDQDILVALHD